MAHVKIYHLSNCTTCQAILKQWMPPAGTDYQCIKETPMTPAQLDEMVALAGSHEVLFSRRALKYKEWGLAKQQLAEKDYREYILKEYTFLRRPVMIIDGKHIFVGNDKKNVAAAEAALRAL